jgi:hypothetical protein
MRIALPLQLVAGQPTAVFATVNEDGDVSLQAAVFQLQSCSYFLFHQALYFITLLISLSFSHPNSFTSRAQIMKPLVL